MFYNEGGAFSSRFVPRIDVEAEVAAPTELFTKYCERKLVRRAADR